MRVAIITETFPPDVNGVAHTVQRAADHLYTMGHAAMVVAPDHRSTSPFRRASPDTSDQGYSVVRVPSLPLPGYPGLRIGLPSLKLVHTLTAFAPDVVHLAAPFVLGAHGLTAARRLGLPTTAVYQTDVPRFAAGYGFGFAQSAAWRWLRTVHNAADRTLAPSTAAIKDLVDHGIERVHLWRRGIDSVRFHPRHRDTSTKQRLRHGSGDSPGQGGRVVVGYVGRLAPEKHLELLQPVSEIPEVSLVIVGDGPSRRSLERLMPKASFLGELGGHDLATAYANLDLFVHTGPFETFCQTVQEALSSGVPVVAPDQGGPRDLVRPGVNGERYRADDAQALASAVREIVRNRDLLARLAAQARESVAGRSWTAIGNELIGHYEDVMAHASASVLTEAA